MPKKILKSGNDYKVGKNNSGTEFYVLSNNGVSSSYTSASYYLSGTLTHICAAPNAYTTTISIFDKDHPVSVNEVLYSNSELVPYLSSIISGLNPVPGSSEVYIRKVGTSIINQLNLSNSFAVCGPVVDCNTCPAPWMKILLSDNTSIEAGSLKQGMKVKTFHEKTMEYGDYEVSYVGMVNSNRLLLKFDHTDFVCSPSHKFHLNNNWVEANSLKAGDVVNGHKLESTSVYDIGQVVKITIDEAHTYICEDMLSHNKSESNPQAQGVEIFNLLP